MTLLPGDVLYLPQGLVRNDLEGPGGLSSNGKESGNIYIYIYIYIYIDIDIDIHI